MQKPSYEAAESAGAFLSSNETEDSSPQVAVDSGVVVFRGRVTEALAKLAGSEALRGCTSRGVADGVEALRLELYSDLLFALQKTDGHPQGEVLSPL